MSETAVINKIETEEELMEVLLNENDPKFNITKLCEELSELQEVLLKYINKKPEKAPSKQAIVDEVGDVFLRLGVVIKQLEVEEDPIGERLDTKISKLIKYYNEGKYKGGL
jgi:hypothetical protein